MTAEQLVRPARVLPGLVISGLLLAGCAPSLAKQADAYARSVAGCYQFDPDQVDARLGLPWGLELREELLAGWPGHEESRGARTWLTAATVADHPFGYWVPVTSDSLRSGYPGGGGLDLMLAPKDGALVGWGRAVGDVARPGDPAGSRPWHPVAARRIACPDR